MKKITYVKFALDLAMAITFVLLFNDRVLGGLTFHEIAGLGIGIAFITHVLLNVNWVKRVTMKLFDRKLPGKTRFGYLLNLLLLVTMTFIIVSGILISRVVFPNVNVGNEMWFKPTHIGVSFIVLILVGIHVGLHWQWVMGVVKRAFKKASHPAVGLVLKLAAAAILLFGGYQMYAQNFPQRVSSAASALFNSGSAQGMEDGKFRMGDGAGFQKGSATGERPTPPQGDFEGKRGGFEGRGEGGPGGESPVNVLLTYFGIMSVFVVITYYLDQLGMRKIRAKEAPAS